MRQNINQYFLEMAVLVGSRSTCDRGRPGCVITKDNHIVATGYAGSPVGQPHCDEIGHELEKRYHDDGTVSEHCVRTTHAEQNALIQAARHGISVFKGSLYCTMTPCYTCAKLIVNAGIKHVYALEDYHDSVKTKRLFLMSGVNLYLQLITEKTYEYEDHSKKDECVGTEAR